MIVQESPSNVISQNVKNNVVGIDQRNVGFITTLLSSKLYSKPVSAFFRETVANAKDSQIEAGKPDEPILISMRESDSGKVCVAIRDYGTGLSPDRFKDVYLNIGSSTKRESNEFIGQLGIGRFSCLSCSTAAHIHNYYNGKCYYYIMYKDNYNICIDEIYQDNTTEENGISVEVELDNTTRYELQDALASLRFYKNIYLEAKNGVIDNYFVQAFNTKKIDEFENFITSSLKCEGGDHLDMCMGDVVYPIKGGYFNNLKYIFYFDITLKFDIGDLHITPNREEVLYDEFTINNIRNKIDATVKELSGIINTNTKSYDYDDFAKLIQDYYSFSLKVPITDYVTIEIPSYNYLEFKISKSLFKFNGQTCNNEFLEAAEFMYTSYNFDSNVLLHYKTATGQFKGSMTNGEKSISIIMKGNPIVLTSDHKLNDYEKRYIRETYKNNFVYIFKEGATLNDNGTHTINYNWSKTYDQYVPDILKYFTDSLYKKAQKLVIPQTYIDNIKASNKHTSSIKKTKEGATAYQCRYSTRNNDVTYDNIKIIDIINKYQTIYYSTEDRIKDYFHIIFENHPNTSKLTLHVAFIKISERNVKYVKDDKRFVDINTIYDNKNNLFAKCIDMYYASKEFHTYVKDNYIYYDDKELSTIIRICGHYTLSASGRELVSKIDTVYNEKGFSVTKYRDIIKKRILEIKYDSWNYRQRILPDLQNEILKDAFYYINCSDDKKNFYLKKMIVNLNKNRKNNEE